MSIEIINKKDQAKGQFNGGEILENKPIGFPRDGGYLKPYSNLFYWAHAWSEKGSIIGEHPHHGFEIVSFVLKGEIEHYDNLQKKWIGLNEGDVQVIKSGSGITHAEKLNSNSAIFQIWFDPDLGKALNITPSYKDYRAKEFPIIKHKSYSEKIYIGKGSSMSLDTPITSISEFSFISGIHSLELSLGSYNSIYNLGSDIDIFDGGKKYEFPEHGFAIIKNLNMIKISVEKEAKLFIVSSPDKLNYKTYTEMQQFYK